MALSVSNLPSNTTVADLSEVFRPFGRVAWAAVGDHRP
ncbi:hypothetical protein [Limnoglobus roseus]